ncbi:Hypothetical predicted protein [Xyrichtys novacula]|uniref:Uncharacterized protein n=1 Tax=Xyrichtys novacula TaxID=13765 RepID=A0AAV1F8J6_XYRNO|nr:Hypothetical predicted protein [Xyrichtys novacula]
MRVLWILCLLIGSITCSPVWKAEQSGSQGLAGTSNMASSYPASWGSGGVESAGLGSSSSGLASPNYVASNAGAGGYGGSGVVYSSPAMAGGSAGGYAGAYAPSAGYGAGASSGGYGGAHGGYGYASAPEGAGSSSGSTAYGSAGGEGSAGPIFSDVSDLDPVYAFSSRSRYQKGRAVFAQSRYTPGEALVQPMPIYRPVIKNPVMISIPVQEPVKTMPVPVKYQTKGGY